MRPLYTIALLVLSNIFMTLAWYGHLKLGDWRPLQKYGLFGIILFSWGLAFFEYCAQVPANKYGFVGNGGSFTLLQLKIMQEVITLVVFVAFTSLFFKEEKIGWNHALGFLLLVAAVYLFLKNEFFSKV